MSKPLILITNDDGVTAPGMKTLIKVARKIGDVTAVAPESPMSGTGHAVSRTKKSLRQAI